MTTNNTIVSILSKMGITAKHIINTSKEKVFDVYLTLKDIESANHTITYAIVQ